MTSNILLFRSYIVFALLFLVPLSLLITQQIYVLIKNYLLISYLFYFSNKNIVDTIDDKCYMYLVSYCLSRKKFFLCISLAELSLFLLPLNKFSIYLSLVYFYKKNKFFYIAEYYSLKALAIMPNDISALNSLLEIYNHLDNPDKVYFIEKEIKRLTTSGSIHQ